ncbi:hypothetical protein LDENG_00012570, partial [Lucifuga dentata]
DPTFPHHWSDQAQRKILSLPYVIFPFPYLSCQPLRKVKLDSVNVRVGFYFENTPVFRCQACFFILHIIPTSFVYYSISHL